MSKEDEWDGEIECSISFADRRGVEHGTSERFKRSSATVKPLE